MHSRRKFLAGLLSTTALAACQSGQTPTLASLLSPANLDRATNLADGLGAVYGTILTDFPQIKGAPSAATIEADIAIAKSTASGLAAIVVPADQGASLAGEVSTVVSVLNALAVALQPGVLPPEVALGLQAASLLAQTLAPLAIAMAGQAKVGAVPLNDRFAPPAGMTVAQANAVLAAKVGKKR